MVILGGWVFLMSEVPLQPLAAASPATLFASSASSLLSLQILAGPKA